MLKYLEIVARAFPLPQSKSAVEKLQKPEPANGSTPKKHTEKEYKMSCKTSRIVTQFDNPGDEIASDGALTVTLTILSRSSCDPKTELYRENRVEMICDALFSGTPANSAHSKSVQILREMSLLLGCLNEDDR